MRHPRARDPLPASANVAGVSPGTVAIVAVWIGGLLLVRRAQRGLLWRAEAPSRAPAVLMALFLVAGLVGGRPALPEAQDSDLWTAALGAIVTAIYLAGIVLRPTRRVAGMGRDSLAVIAAYALGIAGLAIIGG